MVPYIFALHMTRMFCLVLASRGLRLSARDPPGQIASLWVQTVIHTQITNKPRVQWVTSQVSIENNYSISSLPYCFQVFSNLVSRSHSLDLLHNSPTVHNMNNSRNYITVYHRTTTLVKLHTSTVGKVVPLLSVSPVHAVTVHGLRYLTKDDRNAPPQPLVATATQVKHLVHEQEHDSQRNVIVSLTSKQTHSNWHVYDYDTSTERSSDPNCHTKCDTLPTNCNILILSEINNFTGNK